MSQKPPCVSPRLQICTDVKREQRTNLNQVKRDKRWTFYCSSSSSRGFQAEGWEGGLKRTERKPTCLEADVLLHWKPPLPLHLLVPSIQRNTRHGLKGNTSNSGGIKLSLIDHPDGGGSGRGQGPRCRASLPWRRQGIGRAHV